MHLSILILPTEGKTGSAKGTGDTLKESVGGSDCLAELGECEEGISEPGPEGGVQMLSVTNEEVRTAQTRNAAKINFIFTDLWSTRRIFKNQKSIMKMFIQQCYPKFNTKTECYASHFL